MSMLNGAPADEVPPAKPTAPGRPSKVAESGLHAFEDSLLRPGDCWVCHGADTDPIHHVPNHFDPEPRKLCADPQLGTREGWEWCASCAAIREPAHRCYR